MDAVMRTQQEFMRLALTPTHGIKGRPVPICPFADWDYYYLEKELRWVPDSAVDGHSAIEVPAGFVTDLASVPRMFWTLLSPQGRHAYPAIIHDYLYWFQPFDRNRADEVLKVAMAEMGVKSTEAQAIYQSVRIAGSNAWNSNRAAREAGARRILTQFPDTATTTWAEWKSDPRHFL